MNTPEISRAGSTCPSGTKPSTERLKNNPSVTKLTDMKEYRNASNLDHPLTRPVALRRNSVGASPIAAINTPSGSERRLAVHQQVVPDLLLARVDVHDRRLQDALLVGAARVQRQRRPQPHRALALVDVAVQRQQRLEALDRVADRRGADRPQRLAARDVGEVLVEGGGGVQPGAVGRRVEVEDGPLGVLGGLQRPLDPPLQLRLLGLAEGVPGGRV